jgi:predicted secreted hydrolase
VGSLRIDGEILDVEGLSWLDREWSSGSLAANQQGWDWFALQLDEGSDVMFYRLRQRDGSTDPYSGGAWVAPDGSVLPLASDAVSIDALDRWRSPRGGTYPSRWRLALPARGCEFNLTPIVTDQELDVSVRYWEGAVDVAGACDGKTVGGWGYVEMTGYGRSAERHRRHE